jgi:hypothetical protein
VLKGTFEDVSVHNKASRLEDLWEIGYSAIIFNLGIR